MQAVAAQPRSSEPVLVQAPPPPEPPPGAVLCRTRQLGICGTDREILASGRPWIPEGESQLILGHECLAQIEQVGSGVADLASGDWVVPIVRRAAAEAPSDVRVDLLSFGQYTERGIAFEHGFSQPLWLDRPEHLFKVPGELADLAVLTEPLAVAEKAINEALILTAARLGGQAWQLSPPSVLVTGMGPIAFAGVLAATLRAWPVAMYGRDAPDSFRAQLAAQFGARYIPADQFQDDPDDLERDGFDLLLECTASDEVLLRTATALRPRGVAVWLGAARTPQPRSHNLDRLMRHGLIRNHLHIGSVGAGARDFRDALSDLLRARQRLPAATRALITERISLGDSLWHYMHRRPQGIKVVIDFA